MQVAFYLAGEITQVLDLIPWVRCASGNVWLKVLFIYVAILCDNLFCISINFRYSGRIGLVKVSRQEVGAETVTIKAISSQIKSDVQ